MNRFVAIILLSIISVSLVACAFGIGQGCGDGGPVIVNAFPDTLNFILSEEPYVIELQNPESPVFEHTGGRHISFSATSLDKELMNATIHNGNTLRLVALSIGAAEISVTALDDCEFGSGDAFIARIRN